MPIQARPCRLPSIAIKSAYLSAPRVRQSEHTSTNNKAAAPVTVAAQASVAT